MLTVNLEKELLKQNAETLSKDLVLRVQEYDRLGDVTVNDSVLERIGVNTVAKEGKAIKSELESIENQISKFDRTRVFHISQIEKLCKKYKLRFLPAYLFKGAIDKDLACKINLFEIASDIQCKSEKHGERTSNSFIIAPASSFKLEEKPKDPLFMVKIAKDYYYLVHKWGNDLSRWNRIKALFTNPYFVAGLIFIVLSALVTLAALITKEYIMFSALMLPVFISLKVLIEMDEYDFTSIYE